MAQVSLLFAFHHHQPVGNFREVFEAAYRKAYRPLLDAFAAHPGLNVSLSYSGPVLEFLAAEHPDYLEILEDLVKNGRVELLVGTYYEAILAEIPDEDQRAQLNKSIGWINRRFGIEPRGFWLTEGVWHPRLIPVLNNAGLEFTFIRAERFMQAGVSEANLNGHFRTEFFAHPFALFPVSEQLVDLMPYGTVEGIAGFLRRHIHRAGKRAFTFADNAERWGLWPGSHEAVHESGYLDSLLTFLETTSWVQTMTFSEWLDRERARGFCYPPGGPNRDLGAWSLPEGSRRSFLAARKALQARHDAMRFLPYHRAGSWAGFRGRHPEANDMEKKALWLRTMLDDLPGPEREAAHDLLLQAQCSTAYWHGTAGGVYLSHLRDAIWDRLLQVQLRIAAHQPQQSPRLHLTDFDGDGLEECFWINSHQSLGIDPAAGGALFEWSWLPTCAQLAQVVARRDESMEEPSETLRAESLDVVDRHRRLVFRDHVYPKNFTVAELRRGFVREFSNFASSPLEIVKTREVERHVLQLDGPGQVTQTDQKQPLQISKIFRLEEEHLNYHFKIKHRGKLALDALYICELNLLLPWGTDEVICRFRDKERRYWESWYVEKLDEFLLLGGRRKLQLCFRSSTPFSLWSFPVESPLYSSDQPPAHQGNAFYLGWPLRIEPGQEAVFDISVTIAKMT